MTEQQMPEWQLAATEISTAVEKDIGPYIRRVSDDLYESVMLSVQDYLKDNVSFNIASEIATYQREVKRLRKEVASRADIAERMAEALEILLDEADGFSVSGVYFNEPCMGHKGPDLARSALSAFRSATQNTEARHD